MVSRTVPQFGDNALTILCKRYFLKGDFLSLCPRCGSYHETVEDLFNRVSLGNPAYYEMLASFDLFPNSPTWFNIGSNSGGTPSACFKFDIPDSLVGIMEVATKAAMVQKFGGGVGYVLSDLRRKGALVRSTHGKACGPVAVLRVLHAVAVMITQGGKRHGAQMGILHCEHPDIREFIHCKDSNPNTLSPQTFRHVDLVTPVESTLKDMVDYSNAAGGLSTFNLSVALTDEFMKKAQNPNSPQSSLLSEMAESAWKTGDPGCYFIDVAERANPAPQLGLLTGTNPCGEVPLLDNEPCNLGSINLVNFVKNNAIDFKRLSQVTRLAIRYLDDVLDHGSFPTPEIEALARRTRKLGLGVMGWADMLALLRIPYDSEEGVVLSGKVMGVINTVAVDESCILAKEKGPNPVYVEMYGEDEARSLPRNLTRTCIAPTGTISVLAGVSSGIEPHYALHWTRTMGDGTELREHIGVLDRLDGFVPKTADQIEQSWHIRHQAMFQKHTDLAVSKTINMPGAATVEDVHAAFMMMWELGCKGGTIYRDGSRDRQVLNSTPGGIFDVASSIADEAMKPTEVKTLTDGLSSDPHAHHRKKLPIDVQTIRHHFHIGDAKGYVHFGMYPDGSPGEMFITASKQGSTVEGLLDAFAILFSIALQYGVPLSKLIEKMKGHRFEPSGFTNNPMIPNATSVIDYVARWAEVYYLTEPCPAVPSGMVCPDCGRQTFSAGGCLNCTACGWSRC